MGACLLGVLTHTPQWPLRPQQQQQQQQPSTVICDPTWMLTFCSDIAPVLPSNTSEPHTSVDELVDIEGSEELDRKSVV